MNREVALKEIKPEFARNAVSQARFLNEAEITGGLEHPGIVPVYGLGCYEDGRPFYAMRLIQGNSLRESIAAFHADPTLKADPGARALALRKLLRRFLDVCDALAFAHSRGVLHRDLKPDYPYVLNNLGALLKVRGDLDAAISALREAIRLEPGLAIAHDNLFDAMERKSGLDATIDACREAIRANPRLIMAHYNRSRPPASAPVR